MVMGEKAQIICLLLGKQKMPLAVKRERPKDVGMFPWNVIFRILDILE